MGALTLGSLFDGIAGFPEAGRRVGINARWASEVEKFPITVSSCHFPEAIHHGDITKINGAEIEPVDIVTFGSPCTRLSVAGKHDGFGITFVCFTEKGDEQPHYKNNIRATDKYKYIYKDTCPVCGKELTQTNESALFFHAVRIIGEMRSAHGTDKLLRPRFAVWENVPGAFSSNKGDDFRQVLEEIIHIIEPEAPPISVPSKGWATAGSFRDVDGRWSVAWRVLDAQFWGVPQRRRRIFLVADFGGQSAPEILFKREGLSRHLAESGKTGEGTAANIKRGSGETGAGCIAIDSNCQDSRFKLTGQVVPTIPAKAGTGGNNGAMLAIPINDKATRYKGGGESRKNDGSGNGLGVGKLGDPCPTLTAGDKHAVCAGFNGYKSITGSIQYQEESATTLEANMPGNVISINQNISGEVRQGEIANTLSTNSNASGRNAPLIAQAKGYRMTAFGEYEDDDLSSTIKTRDYKDATDLVVSGIDVRNLKENGDISGTLQAKKSGGYSLNYTHPVRQQYSVRRLTPLECERLQGYPDGWTDILGASDSARYKALGNSLAVCCAEYVLEGIVEQIEGQVRK